MKSGEAVILRPMTEAEFPAVRQEMIERFARDQVNAGRVAANWAEAHATGEFDRLLPGGLSTPSHFLHVITRSSNREAIGLVWVCLSERCGSNEAFLCDIAIKAAHRRQGHARQALIALEAWLIRQGVHAIGLHAFRHNTGAVLLYESLGFHTTSVNMYKRLAA